MFLPDWVSGSQVKKTDDCPTQLKHDTVVFVLRQSPEFLCLRINGDYSASHRSVSMRPKMRFTSSLSLVA